MPPWIIGLSLLVSLDLMLPGEIFHDSGRDYSGLSGLNLLCRRAFSTLANRSSAGEHEPSYLSLEYPQASTEAYEVQPASVNDASRIIPFDRGQVVFASFIGWYLVCV
jgi:hypothetical protein